MIIEIKADGGLQIHEPLDFKRFSLRAVRGTALGDSATVKFVDQRFAWISVPALNEWSGTADRSEWLKGVAEMLAFARSKDWVDSENRVRAHIIWVDADTSQEA